MIRQFPKFALLLLLCAISLATPVTATKVYAQDAVDPAERAKIEGIVRQYLLTHPEVLLEAMQALEQRERVAAESQRQETMTHLLPVLTSNMLTPIIGPEDANMAVVEFFDYQCGYCKRLAPDLMQVMDEDKKLAVIFVEYPVLGQASVVAAHAALAAKMQGKYMDYHRALMTHKGRLSEQVIFETAESVGLDVDQLKEDMQKPEVAAYLDTVRGLAEGLGVRGTPSLVIGPAFIPGYIGADDMRKAIADAREQAGIPTNGG